MSKELEKESAKRTRRTQVERVILASLVAAGALTLVAMAPGAAVLLKQADPNWFIKRDPKRRVREAAYRLAQKGLVEFVGEKGKKKLKITPAGERLMEKIELENVQLPRKKKWDKKWRIVIFDIPEKQKGVREKTRRIMARIGFTRLQDSVWIYPYDCEEVIALLKSFFNMGSKLLYIIADAVEYDLPLRKKFSLPLEKR